MADPKAVLVIGAGDATGGAIARRFAREGYIACVTRRSADKLEPLVQRIRAPPSQNRCRCADLHIMLLCKFTIIFCVART